MNENFKVENLTFTATFPTKVKSLGKGKTNY